MSYRLKAAETVPEGIKRIASEEIASAISQLTKSGGKQRDEAIHEARKSLKKIRAALRLVQPELGRVYRAENTRLRDLAHRLSEARDATAILEVFEAILQKYRGNLQPEAFGSIRRALVESKREAERRQKIEQLLRSTLTLFRAEAKRVEKLPLKNDGFSAISAGFEKRYRRGRKAMARAQKDPTSENFHEWRKRVKDHWYHVRLIENLWTGVLQAREAALKDLETWLGDDHNLTVLCGKLRNGVAGSAENDLGLFLVVIDQHQKELREKAIALGRRVYNQKPAELRRDLARLWDAWKRQPEGVEKAQEQEREPAKKQPERAAAARSSKTGAA